MLNIVSVNVRPLVKVVTRVRWQIVTCTLPLTVGTTLAVLGTAFLGWKFGMSARTCRPGLAL